MRFFNFLLSFLLTILVSISAYSRGSECLWFYNSHTSAQSHISNAIMHQLGDLNWVNDQVVFYDGKILSDGRMRFSIPDGKKHWGSMYDGMFNPNTLHGDPRSPMAILGPRLSYLMGYEVKPLNPKLGMNGPVEIVSPGVELTQKTLDKINAVLESQGKETIGLTIKKAGLVSEEEGLRLTLDTPKGFELSFPFHDTSKELTPHEEAYHKTFLIPRELTRRARNINQAIVGFQQLLQKKGLEHYAEYIKDTRWEETDYASGTITTTLAEFNAERISGRLTQESASMHTEKLADLVTIWFRPELTAFESLVQYMTFSDSNLRVYLQRHHPRWVENALDPKNRASDNGPDLISSNYRGSEEMYPMISQLLKDYENTLRSEIRPSLRSRRSAQAWAEDILLNHENRTAEITAALEAILRDAGVTTATGLFNGLPR